ncbi:hypothetical protein [Agrobacterium tumefaciens]|uniref:hypothetical protein n=1 Tax=Agrobacterium tumefaciens TaxID=358 RepID=UPI000FBE6C46|nr:hypothetical protein [Agrobacterium tumefaciens]
MTPGQMKHDADHYGLRREEASGAHHGAGWWVSLRRRGHRIVRLFKDSVYGSGGAAYRQARAYRDAIILAIAPATNLEQAVLLRRNNRSGISGVRRVETADGDVWQVTLTTREGQKKENFSIARFGEEAAKSMAITTAPQMAESAARHPSRLCPSRRGSGRHQFGQELTPADDISRTRITAIRKSKHASGRSTTNLMRPARSDCGSGSKANRSIGRAPKHSKVFGCRV